MVYPASAARYRNHIMWQLEMEATNASSGSTRFGSPQRWGADEAGTSTPPSNRHTCERSYFVSNSAPPRVHTTWARCSDTYPSWRRDHGNGEHASALSISGTAGSGGCWCSAWPAVLARHGWRIIES